MSSNNSTPLRGLNLGGWLVLERWITPVLFDPFGAQDEVSLTSVLQGEMLRELLTKHRETFISGADFRWIASRGFNAVRIPVPWYLFGDVGHHDRCIGCIDYLDRAMSWSDAYGLRVLIDVHTASGSQNGKDHSGAIGAITWHEHDDNRVMSLNVINQIAQRYKDHPALFGIELLNEPILKHREGLSLIEGIPAHLLRNFYRSGYRMVRNHCDENIAVVLHDAFRPDAWGGFMSSSDYQNVWMDLHRYHCYGKEAETIHQGRTMERALDRDEAAIKKARRGNKRVMVGEWSGGLAIAETALLPEARRAFERLYVGGQIKAFSQADAWFFWTYKTEQGLQGWDARKTLAFLERDMIMPRRTNDE